MSPKYCSKGHENPSGSHFCLQCGEALTNIPVNQMIQPGQTLDGRYLIVRQLGQGGFGKTYLAENINRFNEVCVLKEFSPQIQTDYVLQKAEELFQREASVLYKLEHPQIPRFRELLRTNYHNKKYLFLVQDYVEGKTYNSLLQTKLEQGLHFSEAEIIQLLQQILPVLDYIHSLGVIHRDISPDNLILRSRDQLPVLIDFGGVKQVAAEVASQYYQPGVGVSLPQPTVLGKAGYAPPEQMQTGLVAPHSDLYALAATALVLLTGKQPTSLIDTYTLNWQWRQEVTISLALGQILDRMLLASPTQRYQSATEVLQALNNLNLPSIDPTQPPIVTPQTTPTEATLAVSPAVNSPVKKSSPKNSTSPPPNFPPPPSHPSKGISSGILGKIIPAMVIIGAVSIGVWAANNFSGGDNVVTPTEEEQKKEQLNARRNQLGIDANFFTVLVEQEFKRENPNFQGNNLNNIEDPSLGAKRDKIASELLDQLSTLSSDARRRLGFYRKADRDHWKVRVNNINVGSRSLYDLGDAAFFQKFKYFPEQQGNNFIETPMGQVWHGFVADKLNAILARSAYQKITFDVNATSKTVSGNFRPGQGKVFIADLRKEQLMNLKLDASSRILLSVYSPSGKVKFLQDSTRRNLSIKLPENGFYEFVLASISSESQNYQLRLSVETPPEPTPTPDPDPTPTETPTPDPTPTETPTPDPTPTETPTPTPDPTPTETPTPDPTPTETPTPTPTPTKTVNPDPQLPITNP
ncbi:MAG: serine/threonine-protein kinase [Cyanobacteria bacterium J06639_18]